MKKKTRVLIISYTAALVAARAIGLIACRTDANRRQTAMDANYRHAYGEVLNAVQELNSSLQKSLYATTAAMETLGQVKLGELNAYGVSGATVQKQLEAYLIPTADGCVSVVLCRAGTAPAGWYESLLASAQTLQITG